MSELTPALRPFLVATWLASLPLAACTSAPPAASTEASAGCAAVVGRYRDAALREGTSRTTPLAEVLGLDADTTGPVPEAERAVDVRQLGAARYVLAIAKTTPPDTISLWDVPMRCEGEELRFETTSRYQSSDGVHVTREQLRFALSADADGTLIVRRELRKRALGLLDLHKGGTPQEFFRFPKLAAPVPPR